MAKLLEVRVGGLLSHTEIREKCVDGKAWPKEEDTGWIKHVVDGPVKTHASGLEGDLAGSPTHNADGFNRGALVYHEDDYETLLELYPKAKARLSRGGFGENFVVKHPSLHSSVVCIGDKFRIGTAVFHVSGARHTCPKVDAWHNEKGMSVFTNAEAMGGYFLRVDELGEVRAGDKIELLERPHPGYTVQRISRGLWGTPEQLDSSVEFLTYVSKIEELIPRHFRDTATLRLQRLNDKAADPVPAGHHPPVGHPPIGEGGGTCPFSAKGVAKAAQNSENQYMLAIAFALLAFFFACKLYTANNQ